MNSKYCEVFLEVRDFLIKEINEKEVIERLNPKITSYFSTQYSSGFCYLRTTEKGLRIAWFKGSSLRDKHSLLRGKGKKLRALTITKFTAKIKSSLCSYINESKILMLEKDAINAAKRALR